MSTRSSRQGGWVASFVVVGAVLLVALLGSIYFLKHHTSSDGQIAKTNSSKTATQPKSASDNSTDKSSSGNTNSSTSQTPAGQSGSSSSSEQASPTNTPTPTATQDATMSTLPTTGPKDTLIDAVILSLLSFVIASYARSRRLMN